MLIKHEKLTDLTFQIIFIKFSKKFKNNLNIKNKTLNFNLRCNFLNEKKIISYL